MARKAMTKKQVAAKIQGGQDFARFLSRKKITDIQCSHLLGVSDVAVWRWKTGKRTPEREMQARVFDLMGYVWDREADEVKFR